MTTKNRIVKFRRKREQKTDYKKRLTMLKAKKPRLVIRRFAKNITGQIVEYKPAGDKIIVGVSSSSLVKLGWKASRKNVPASYLTGYKLGKEAITKGVKEVIVDTGLFTPTKGSKIYALMKGVIDAGVAINCKDGTLPVDERLSGEHIAQYAESLKKDKPDEYAKRFADYQKKGFEAGMIKQHFEEIKKKIEG